jgi:NADH dehydrogenase FAD-containing subunit
MTESRHNGQDGQPILVIGAGYAGLAAAARAGRKRQVTLIAPEERFVNRVRLHEISAGRPSRQPEISHVLRGRNVTHIRARVTELDLAARKVFTDGGPSGEGEAATTHSSTRSAAGPLGTTCPAPASTRTRWSTPRS